MFFSLVLVKCQSRLIYKKVIVIDNCLQFSFIYRNCFFLPKSPINWSIIVFGLHVSDKLLIVQRHVKITRVEHKTRNFKKKMNFIDLKFNCVCLVYGHLFWLVLHRKPCIGQMICEHFWFVKCKVIHFYVKTHSKASWIVKPK